MSRTERYKVRTASLGTGLCFFVATNKNYTVYGKYCSTRASARRCWKAYATKHNFEWEWEGEN